MRTLETVATLALLVATPVAHGARGEWYDHYQVAQEALQRGDFAAAIDRLDQAQDRRERPGYARTYGNNYLRYLPYFQRAVARAGLGDCERALEAARLSREAGEIQRDAKAVARLETLEATCAAALAPPATDPGPRPDPVESVPVEPIVTAPAERPFVGTRAELETAFGAYLRGDLEQAVTAFDALARESPRSARVRLWLGLSLYNRWTAGGKQDEQLFEAASDSLRQAATLDGNLRPDPALCPPAVISLFNRLRRGRAGQGTADG